MIMIKMATRHGMKEINFWIEKAISNSFSPMDAEESRNCMKKAQKAIIDAEKSINEWNRK
tara:strand:+ start:276 stop:455 length:180 start_codon:yes stop_codon:yes gene_type:complete